MQARKTSYCAGLPLDGERPLSDEERARVLAQRRGAARAALSRALLVPLALAPGFAATYAVDAARGPLAAFLTAAAFVLFGLVAPLAAVLYLRAAVVTWLRLGRDVRGGVSLRFAREARSVTVLPHSGSVLAWDDAPAAPGRRLVIGEAAEVPATAATYAVDAATAGAAPGLDLVRRPLSPAEREEIGQHANTLGRLPVVLLVFTAAFALLALEVLGAGEAPDRGEVGLVLVWGVLLAYAWSRSLRARRLARRLREDESNGWALRATSGEPAGNEVLAVSGAAWTVQGAPAPWRTLRGRTRGGGRAG